MNTDSPDCRVCGEQLDRGYKARGRGRICVPCDNSRRLKSYHDTGELTKQLERYHELDRDPLLGVSPRCPVCGRRVSFIVMSGKTYERCGFTPCGAFGQLIDPRVRQARARRIRKERLPSEG